MLQTSVLQHSLGFADVTKVFGFQNKVITVLSSVTYLFETGTSYAIVGASGSGKSTLLHILAGFDRPDTGSVTWSGNDCVKMSAEQRDVFVAQHLGFVFQFHYLLKELNVYDNVRIASLVQGREVDIDDLLRKVGMYEARHQFPHQLSGGQQQRTAVARALVGKPQFVLADEPTGNLDEHNSMQVVDLLLAQKNERGMGLVIATHDPAVYERMDVILEVHDGALTARKGTA